MKLSRKCVPLTVSEQVKLLLITKVSRWNNQWNPTNHQLLFGPLLQLWSSWRRVCFFMLRTSLFRRLLLELVRQRRFKLWEFYFTAFLNKCFSYLLPVRAHWVQMAENAFCFLIVSKVVSSYDWIRYNSWVAQFISSWFLKIFIMKLRI